MPTKPKQQRAPHKAAETRTVPGGSRELLPIREIIADEVADMLTMVATTAISNYWFSPPSATCTTARICK